MTLCAACLQHSRWSPPGGIELVEALGEDVLEDVADARAARQLADRHVLAAPIQHLAVPRRVAVQQLQQQRAPAACDNSLHPACLPSRAVLLGFCFDINERQAGPDSAETDACDEGVTMRRML